MPLFTIGHSNTDLETFLDLLRAHEVAALADVRSFPASRRHPHFARESLAATLPSHGIDYRWFPGLGGRRKPIPGSRHTGWQVAGFQAYADYMETPEFERALAELLEWARGRLTSVLCAERLWWQCHRRLVSDRLVTRGHPVRHILEKSKAEPHRVTEFARLEGDRLIYDGGLFEGAAEP